MGLHKTSMVHGIGAYLEQRGLIGWASEKVASDVYEHIAGQLQGPEQLTTAGLDAQSAYKIAELITATHRDLVPQGFGGDRSLAMQKQAAAQNDIETLAIMTAGSLMQKRADAMIMNGGEHTNRAGESPDTLARLDQSQRPQGQYLTGVGNTDMPDGPSPWASMPHPVGHGNTVPVSNSITKGASYNVKQAWAGAANELIHGPAALGRIGLDQLGDNAQRALFAGGTAALGAGVGAASADEGQGWQGAGIGALAGGALGGGLAAGSTMNNAVGRGLRQPGLALGLTGQAAGEALSSGARRAAALPGDAMSGWGAMSPEARYAITGGLGAGALGAAGGAVAGGEDNRLQGALLGGAGGAALGAGGGAAIAHGWNGHALPGLAQKFDSGPMNPEAAKAIASGGGQRGMAYPKDVVSQMEQRPMPGAGGDFFSSGPANPHAYAAEKARMGGVDQQRGMAFPSEVLEERTASDISELLRKIASGGSLTDSPKNTPSDAAKHDELAALDLKNRSKDKYVGVAGHSSFPNVNQDFHVQHMPGAPKTGPSTVSSREIKSASDMTSDEQLMFAMFNKTASEVAPYLPSYMPQETKIAHVRAMMGLDNAERVTYLNALYNQR